MGATGWQRVYFAAVGSFALWVGLWGYFMPEQVARAIPWHVPPLHARFIGSMYLSGAVLMAGGLLTSGRRNVGVSLWMAAIWTGMLLVVSLIHLGEFDFARPPVWFWFAAYLVYPVAGVWLAWVNKAAATDRTGDVPAWLRGWLMVQSVVFLALALLLFAVPGPMSELWPWKIPVLLAQIYSGPFLSYGIGGLLALSLRRLADLAVVLMSMLAFTALVLAASVMHRAVFGDIGLAATLWFAGFAVATVVLTLACAKALSARAASLDRKP